MIGHEKPLPAFASQVPLRLKCRDANYWFWPVCMPRSALSLASGDECRGGRAVKSIVVVFQFDDLRLRLD
jgi:hypothetical protein